MKIHCLQHIAFETPGSILEWARKSRHTVRITRLDLGETLPAVSDFDWLIIMGGPMNVYEENTYPWLHEEKALIREAAGDGKTILGFCLGAQLLAVALGGKVTCGKEKEIGWHPVHMTAKAQSLPLFSFLPPDPVVFQWHGDTFSTLPEGALLTAEGTLCRNQAFMIENRIFGFQFHMENTPAVLSDLVRECGNELQDAPYIQKPEDILGHPEHIQENNRWIHLFLSRLEQQKKDLLSL